MAASIHVCVSVLVLLAALVSAQNPVTRPPPVSSPELTEGPVIYVVSDSQRILTKLKGENSSDAKFISKYIWTQIAGPPADIVTEKSSTSANIKLFVTVGHYEFNLTVVDVDGLTDDNTVAFDVKRWKAHRHFCIEPRRPCSNTSRKCVDQSQICNGIVDCWDGSDEQQCPVTRPPPVSSPELTEGPVIYVLKDHEKVSTCLHGDNSSDANFISKYIWTQIAGPPARISEEYPNAPNIKVHDLTVGHYEFNLTVVDVDGRSDENTVAFDVQHWMVYPNTCEEPRRRCSDGSKCINPYQFCNGVLDCWDGSDERECPAPVQESSQPNTVWIGVPTGIISVVFVVLAIFFCTRRRYCNKRRRGSQPRVVVSGTNTPSIFTITSNNHGPPDYSTLQLSDLHGRIDGATNVAYSIYPAGASLPPPPYTIIIAEPPSYSHVNAHRYGPNELPPSYYDVLMTFLNQSVSQNSADVTGTGGASSAASSPRPRGREDIGNNVVNVIVANVPGTL